MCDDCDCQPTERQLEHAVKRNFGGLEESVLNTYEIFQKHLSVIEREANVVNNIIEFERDIIIILSNGNVG